MSQPPFSFFFLFVAFPVTYHSGDPYSPDSSELYPRFPQNYRREPVNHPRFSQEYYRAPTNGYLSFIQFTSSASRAGPTTPVSYRCGKKAPSPKFMKQILANYHRHNFSQSEPRIPVILRRVPAHLLTARTAHHSLLEAATLPLRTLIA